MASREPDRLATGGSSWGMRDSDRYYEWMFELFRPYIRGSILEIGCGAGNLTRYLLKSGPVYAIDIAEEGLLFLSYRLSEEPSLRVRQIDLSDPGASLGERFGTVVMVNVLEHIEDEEAMLGSIRNHLQPDGRFICLVPAQPMLFSRMDRAAGHYRRYSEPRFRATLERNGFRVRTMIKFNPVGAMGWFLNKVFGGGGLTSRETGAQISAFEHLVPVLKRVHMPAFPFALSLIAVAEPEPAD